MALLQGTRLLSGRLQSDSVGTLPASFVVTKTTFLQKLTALTFILVIGLGFLCKRCFSHISYQPPDGKKKKKKKPFEKMLIISGLLLSLFFTYSMVIMAWGQYKLK